MAVFWRASILQPVILTLICMFGSTMCDGVVFTSVKPDEAICPSETPVSLARSIIECAVACTGNPNCRSFGYPAPIVNGLCLVSEMDKCALVLGGKTFRKPKPAEAKPSCFLISGLIATGTTFMFMQRFVGDVNFARNWSQYENGFGNYSGDFWLGLRNIKSLLGSTSATWRVEMKQWTGESWFLEFNGFTVRDSSTNYTIIYAGMGAKNSTISTAAVPNNTAFSTMDRDNDKKPNSPPCTEAYNGNGGIWFTNCGMAFPTAVFPPTRNASIGYMIWHTGDAFVSLRDIRMYLKRLPRTHLHLNEFQKKYGQSSEESSVTPKI